MLLWWVFFELVTLIFDGLHMDCNKQGICRSKIGTLAIPTSLVTLRFPSDSCVVLLREQGLEA